MKSSLFKPSKRAFPNPQEKGMAMIMALLMGFALVAGATGLLIRQMVARKLGAAESYNQLAESAALNGLNRIISDLNRDDRDNYTGFLLTLRNDSEQWGWSRPNMPETQNAPFGTELVELCTPVNRYISAYPDGTTGKADFVQINTSNIRDDGVDEDIEVGYRLRSYNTTATAGNGEGSFYIEGIVRRGETILARALLKRALYISSRVAGAGDWAVMSGHNLRLNDTSIDGPGYVFYLTKSPDQYRASEYASRCFSSLQDDVGASNQDLGGPNDDNQIWPININESKRGVSGLPPTNLFEKDRGNDTTKSSNGRTIRIWSFDDNLIPADKDGDGKIDRYPNGQVILYPPLPCEEIVCVRDADQTDADDFRTLAEEGINVPLNNGKITLTEDLLCNGVNTSDCHLYLDHINLSKTKLHLEASDSKAIVLRLDQPINYPSDLNLTQSINLSGTSELCAAKRNNNGTSRCSEKPEQLVIMATAESEPTTDACGTTKQSVIFSGTTLPYALLYLPTGTARPSNATLTGLIWANSICVLDNEDNPSSFTLKTEQNGISVVQKANDHWGWTERFNYPGYGRMVTRAIRGTSLDVFERW